MSRFKRYSKKSARVVSSLLVASLFLVLYSSFAYGVDQQLQLQVPAPSIGTELTLCSGSGDTITCNGIAAYITAIYEWLIRIAIVLGVLTLTLAGYFWMTARGDKKQTEKAVTMVKNTLWGIVLALGSYALLWAINPNLVQFNVLNLGKKIEEEKLIIENENPPFEPVNTSVGPGQCGGDLVNIARNQFVSKHACVGACHCAWFVSMALRASGCEWANHNGAQGLMDLLLSHGWTQIDRSAAQPGDISIWKDGGERAGHIAIYAGDGKCIQAGTLRVRGAKEWCNLNNNFIDTPIPSSNACTQVYPNEQRKFFSSACHTPQCIGEFASCGKIVLHLTGTGGAPPSGRGGALPPPPSGRYER